MATFKDTAGNEWTPAVTVASVKRVRQLLDLDLLDLQEGGVLQRLAQDHVLLVDVLYVVCKDQADHHGITDEAFGGAMRGDVLAEATDAFLEELAVFFPRQKREILLKMLTKFRAMEGQALARVSQVLDSPKLEEDFQKALDADTAVLQGPPDSGD